MERKNLDRYYAENSGLIHTVARKGYGRLMQIGAAVEYEDIFQDLVEVFIKAYDRFDESFGVQFSTYFMRSAFNELNKKAKTFEAERLELGMRSIEELSAHAEEEGGVSIEEKIASDAATPEQTLIARSAIDKWFDELSPVAAMIAGLTLDPPDFIEREFYGAMSHAEMSREMGVERRARGSLNVGFVCSVLEKTTNMPPRILNAARKEVLEACGKELSL